MTRFLRVLLVSVLLLGGCALVDDARREFGSEPSPRAARSSAVPAASPSTASPSTASPVAAEPSGGPGGCPPNGVLIKNGSRDAAMGLRVISIELVNCGPGLYELNGYPTVRLLDENRRPLPVTFVPGSAGITALPRFDDPPVEVVAAPTQRLTFGLVWRGTVTDLSGPIYGTYLEVTPAPGRPPQIVEPDGRIDVGTTARLGVSPWGKF